MRASVKKMDHLLRKIGGLKEGPMANIYRSETHPEGWYGLPEYELREGKIYRTAHHPLGISSLPDYEVRAGDMIYRTVHHPLGISGLPDYELRSGKIYRAKSHPAGCGSTPDYEISLEYPEAREEKIGLDAVN